VRGIFDGWFGAYTPKTLKFICQLEEEVTFFLKSVQFLEILIPCESNVQLFIKILTSIMKRRYPWQK